MGLSVSLFMDIFGDLSMGCRECVLGILCRGSPSFEVVRCKYFSNNLNLTEPIFFK